MWYSWYERKVSVLFEGFKVLRNLRFRKIGGDWIRGYAFSAQSSSQKRSWTVFSSTCRTPPTHEESCDEEAGEKNILPGPESHCRLHRNTHQFNDYCPHRESVDSKSGPARQENRTMDGCQPGRSGQMDGCVMSQLVATCRLLSRDVLCTLK